MSRTTQSGLRMTHALAMAIGADVGNTSMRQGGRTVWNEQDWNVAATRTAAKLAESEPATPQAADQPPICAPV